jgi:signal transduction histidine kinase
MSFAETSTQIRFSVDSAILRELGERLVGKPHIALAELVKNAYDADATIVEIRFARKHIEVVDNGHGMSEIEFRQFWMRVGSSHKGRQLTSRFLARPLTGSKGVGRLAAQFLARELELTTTSADPTKRTLTAWVDWETAISSGELTQAVVNIDRSPRGARYPGGAEHGTRIMLRDLNQNWGADEVRSLAREIWWLRQPFRSQRLGDDALAFEIRFESEEPVEQKVFETQIDAIMGLYKARLDGRLLPERDENGDGTVELALQFEGETTPKMLRYKVNRCVLRQVDFQIRIYKLEGRLGQGIAVGEAREYMRQYGGVHVYDRGFHLPYYGPEQDWLGTEQEHSRREWTSKLLPPELLVSRGLNDLPTNARILGAVFVDTASEEQQASEEVRRRNAYLQIQLTRDRLVQNAAYENLVFVVKFALHYYANEFRRRENARASAKTTIKIPEAPLEGLRSILDKHKKILDGEVYKELYAASSRVVNEARAANEELSRKANLLGALASVGISTLAFQHELGGMTAELENITRDLRDASVVTDHSDLAERTATRLEKWLERLRGTRGLFTHLLEVENREVRVRMNAATVLKGIHDNLGTLSRGVSFDASALSTKLMLPIATFAEWTAIFQNVYLNAVNAMLDTPRSLKRIHVSSASEGKRRFVRVSDTGVGIDLDDAERFFEAFERGLRVSEERRSLGFGGTGLGLTITKTIAENLGCKVMFVEPIDGFATTFEMSWEERTDA